MMDGYRDIRLLIGRVRARWRAEHMCHAMVRVALYGVAAVGVMLVAATWILDAPRLLTAIAAVAALAIVAAIVWFGAPLGRPPTDSQVARFIEERAPELEDRLVTAVDHAERDRPTGRPAGFDDLFIADAARRARDVDVETILSAETVRRAGFQAAAATLALLLVVIAGRGTLRETADAAALTLFPARVTLDVTPGHARIKAGDRLAVHARLVGNKAPVIAQFQVADGDRWRSADMRSDKGGAFELVLEAVTAPFKYRVVAGTVTSPTYDVSVAHAPRVSRIDVDYTYPAGLGLPPRTEEDSGDIYAPAGTDVRVHVFTDRPASNGRLTLNDGKAIELSADKPTELTATLKVVDDSSYRVALADREGMSNNGETEYFIRTLEDRPPDVRVLKPAQDRSVTRLEEVDIEAQAEDDYGVARLDLVYSVRGGAEKTVPLPIPRQSTIVKGGHTLFLEDLDVQAGDFISYYVRARDLTRGTRPNEARSDIFFLEVKPFDQEFALAASQAMAGAGGRNSLDDLVTAQKNVIVSTFKLDRRAQATRGAKSEQDIKTVSRAESELKDRVEQTSSTFRESTMRDPRRRPQGRGAPPPPRGPKAGETLPEEDQMALAAAAMEKAVSALDALKTGPALQPEMEALNHLLKAQDHVKKREVQRQQAGSGAGNNRSNYDLSTLFDRELKKTQQTNYETKTSAEQKDDPNQSALDKIKELAARQDELLKKQQELARNRETMTEEELKRQIEQLTREQSELRQRAEDLARQMSGQQSRQQQDAKNGQTGQQNPGGQQSQSGQQSPSGRQGQSGQQGQSSQQAESQGQGGQSGGDNPKRMREVSDEMRNAASDLRRQDPKQASASGSRALDKLRELQRQLEASRPDDRRRALGELQLEARQLADAERQIASELGQTPSGDAGADSARRLAGEQERLAERTRKLQDGLKQQASAAKGPTAAGDAAREIERQRLAERMQQSSDAIRATTGGAANGRGRQPSEQAKTQAASQQDVARSLDKIADKLAAATGAQDGESRKLADQLARAQELREKLDEAGRRMDQMSRQNGGRGQPGGQNGQRGETSTGATKSAGETGRAGEGQSGGGGGSGTELARLREEYSRRLQETKELMDQLKRDDPNGQTYARGGAGFTFEGQGMTLSAPGTEAFKQDFAKWETLRRQATQALENVESAIAKKLQEKQSKDRLAAGADDKPPAEYQKQVDSYFKAIAKKKQ
jgi:DNA repair exonuclease SbcCD ATPase subunit